MGNPQNWVHQIGHVCLLVNDLRAFVNPCRQQGMTVIEVPKGDRNWNQTINRSEPFLTLLGDDYSELTAFYNTKPFAIWELADRHRGSDWFYRYSSKWFERTYAAIESLPRCRLVVFFDFRLLNQGLENQLFIKRNIAMFQNVAKGGYFLTGGINAPLK